jgi:hypothetical protein
MMPRLIQHAHRAPTTTMQRDILAGWLSGHTRRVGEMPAEDLQRLLEVARREGVLALAQQALAGMESAPPVLIQAFSAAARRAAMPALAYQGEARRLCRKFADAGLQPIVLKGLALGAWLYPQPYLREISDIDLLFGSHSEAGRAAQLLEEDGYVVHYQPGELAQEFLCRGRVGTMPIDLDMHWKISAMPLFRQRLAHAQLWAQAIPLSALGPDARGLGAVHAFAHASIHRASNVCSGIGDRLKWLYDLHLLAQRFDADDWARLLRLCRERGLCGVVAEAIEATAAAFGPVVPAEVMAALAADRAAEPLDASRLRDWGYIQRQNLRALPTLSLRARWLWQRVFPPKGYLRELYGKDVSVPGLWLERVRRAIGRLSG